MKKFNKGFTLIELLVVVLIIGVLSSIALPQYRKAVLKAKVATLLPTMRRWKDAMMEYNLRHGYYCENAEQDKCPSVDDFDANWPADWTCPVNNFNCESPDGYWSCLANPAGEGEVSCWHSTIGRTGFFIHIYQPDDGDVDENIRGRILCEATASSAAKACEDLGGIKASEESLTYYLF